MTAQFKRDLLIIFAVVILNTVFCIVYYLYHILRKKKKENDEPHYLDKYTVKFLIMLVCPFIGPLFLVASHIMYKIIRRSTKDWIYAEFSKEKDKTPFVPSEERDLNMVPIGEAIAISDTKRLRRLLLDVLKDENVDASISAIVLALESTDPEASHYAASVIMDTISKFQISVFALRDKIRQDPEDFESEEKLCGLIFYYVNSGILSDYEKESFVSIADETLEGFWFDDIKKVTPELYLGMTEALLEVDKPLDAEKWADRAMAAHPNTIESFKASLKTNYKLGNVNEFFKVLDKLKKSKIEIDSETLAFIRLMT